MVEYLRRSRALLPTANAYRTRLALAAVQWLEPDADERARLFASVERCMRHCFPSHHPGLAFYLRQVAAATIERQTAAFLQRRRPFLRSSAFLCRCDRVCRRGSRHFGANFRRAHRHRAAAPQAGRFAASKSAGNVARDCEAPVASAIRLLQQAESVGGIRRLQPPSPQQTPIRLDTPNLLSMSIGAHSPPKSSHGSAKERAQHRRTHRAVTPLPPGGLQLPPLANDAVQFADAAVAAADDKDENDDDDDAAAAAVAATTSTAQNASRASASEKS